MATGAIVASPARRLNHLTGIVSIRGIMLSQIAAFARLERYRYSRRTKVFEEFRNSLD